MPALARFAAVPELLLRALTVLFFALPMVAQSRLDDVHVSSQVPGPGASAILSKSVNRTDLHTIHQDVNLVLIPVSVSDDRERSVVGLKPDNFKIFDGKKERPISNFSSEDSPVSVGFIVDTSGSMRDKMDRVREAVTQFCDAANPQDEFFIITFADRPNLAADFTNAPGDIEKELLFA